MDWRALLSFYGRNNRARYWQWVLLVAIASALLNFIAPLAKGAPLFWIVLAPAYLAVSVFGLCNQARRLHDFGRSGWWVLAPYVVGVLVCVGLAVLGSAHWGVVLGFLCLVAFGIGLGIKRGDAGANRFGEPLVTVVVASAA